MFYHFIYPLSKYFFGFNVVHYITFRVASAFITSFVLLLIFGNIAIQILERLNIKERIDMYGYKRLEDIYRSKQGTPTMGGIIIIFSVLISMFLWARWDNRFVWYAMSVMLLLGFVGLKDDLLKIKKGKGLKRSEKLFFQILVGVFLGVILFLDRGVSTRDRKSVV